MRVLYALLGEPGTGKSSFIKEHHLEDQTISTDTLRTLFTGKDYSWDPVAHEVREGLSQGANKQVFNLLDELLESKAKEGRTIYVDATHLYKNAFSRYHKIKDRWGYRIYVIDFRAKSQGMTFDSLVAANNDDYRVANGANVSNAVLKKFYNRAETEKIPGFCNVISPYDWKETTYWKVFNANNYKQIKVIGDIHGCYDVLHSVTGDKLDDNTLYIFLGDYLDRGPQNVETFKYLLSIKNEPNTVFLRGNHELHWDKFTNGLPVPSRETNEITIPELMRAGITKKQIDSFRRRLQDITALEFNGVTYLATHAGLPVEVVNDRSATVYGHYVLDINGLPEDVFTKGIGAFKMDVDADYGVTNNSLVQLHGHRNEFGHDEDEFSNIYNLEQGVERGHALGVVTINTDGVTTEAINNPNFRLDQAEDDLNIDLSKVSDKDIYMVMMHSRNIANNNVEADLIAHNFTSAAFHNDVFNKFTVTARGLFTDTTGDVMGRGFSKFFNVNQNEESSWENIIKHPFPAVATKKYDGFLTLVFQVDGKLKVLSKAGGKDYSEQARKDLLTHLEHKFGWDNKKAVAELVGFLGKNDYTVVMETVDKGDDHIVRYRSSFQVVLSAVANQYALHEDFTLADAFAKKFSLRRPEKVNAKSLEELELIYDAMKQGTESYTNNINTEGYVVRFDDGFRFKLKNTWYLENKALRHELDTLAKDPDAYREGIAKGYRSRYNDVYQTMLNFSKLDNDKITEFPTRAITFARAFSGSVDLVKLRAMYPSLFVGELNENSQD